MHSIINTTERYCGLNPNTSIAWQNYFHKLYFDVNHFTIRCLFSELIPTGAIILFNSYIIYHIVRTYRRLHHTNNRPSHQRQIQTTS